MGESTNDGSAKIILGVIALIIGVIVGYFVYTKYLQGKLGNIGSNTNTTDPTPDPTPTTTTTTNTSDCGTSQGCSDVSITAVDNSDPIPRDWNIFTRDPAGTYLGGGNWGVGDPLQKVDKSSGGTWNLTLPKGTYYLLIGQSGGSGFGTYSGSLICAGQTFVFSGLDVNHSFKFVVPN